MHTIHSRLNKAVHAAAITVLFAAVSNSNAGLRAQQPVAPVASATTLRTALTMPPDLFAGDTSSSSSTVASDADAVASERFALGDSLQPPPRRGYGRPRYTDSSHNPDGSNKYLFEVGGGFTLPTGGTHNALKTNYSFQGGVGRNFSKTVGVIAQFDWDNFGIQTSTLNNLLAIYNNAGATDANGNSLTQLNGSSHDWSFTLNPMYTYMDHEKAGAYVIAGAGFYHKTATFTIPAVGEECSVYYGCIEYQANEPIDSYTSNAFGANLGLGFTYKLSRFANEKLYAEARYVYNANTRRPYYDGVTGTSLSSTYFNVFPQNSAPTTYIPVKFGIRF